MKHMKKSMFITTIFMVVLLIVAVSTATFAWYTSSNTVNTVATEVSSAESTGANISIGWKDNTPVGSSSLVFKTNAEPFNPMVPINEQGDAALTFATINNLTPFATSHLSFGSLSGIGGATPYVGASPEDSDTVFYIVNYALKATNITFTATVNGENAARLRVAVFNATTGNLVFVNKDFSYGTQMDAVPAHYAVTTEKPSDWDAKFATYFTKSGDDYSAVIGVAPVWKNNTYYLGGVVQNTAGDGNENAPSDWSTDYHTYTTADGTPVAAVAPAWAESTYYKSVLEAGKYLSCNPATQKITAQSVATNIIASNGTTGVAQGFIVKAWFDGPTQVDAYGGQKATFTLTATAS